MESALIGAAAALVILGVFFAGFFVARRLTTRTARPTAPTSAATTASTASTAERRPYPSLTEEQEKERDRVRADNNAFFAMMRYNIRDVYGMNSEDNFGSKG